jgi:HEAT repeat protein
LVNAHDIRQPPIYLKDLLPVAGMPARVKEDRHMRSEHILGLILARIVDLMRSNRPDREAQRAALHALVRHTNDVSATVRLEGRTLSVEGCPVPADVPHVREFIERMRDHGIAEIRIAHSPAPLDLIDVLRVIASDPADRAARERLHRPEESTVHLVGLEASRSIQERKEIRVTEAIVTHETPPPSPSPPPPDITPEPEHEREPEPEPEIRQNPEHIRAGSSPGRETISGLIPADEGAAYNLMLELTKEPEARLTRATSSLQAVQDADELSSHLSQLTAGIANAARTDRVTDAIEAMIVLVQNEAAEDRDDFRVRYGVALQRVLDEVVLEPFVPFLIDELFAKDVAAIMRRAGATGTRLLLKYLVDAETFAERRAFMEALVQIDTGKDIVVKVLDHHEWYVVRNIAEVVGELRVAEGVPGLGRAVKHPDVRVRRAAAIALAKIGAPDGVRFLNECMRDSDREVRLGVLKHMHGRGVSAMAMLLVNIADTEHDPDMRAECFRALGRIGTPDAVRALINESKPGNFLLARHSVSTRIAVVEGLSLAGGPTAKEALEDLARGRGRQVREAARDGLRALAAGTGAAAAAPPATTPIRLERRGGRDRRADMRRKADRLPSGEGIRWTMPEHRSGLDRRTGLERRLFGTPDGSGKS